MIAQYRIKVAENYRTPQQLKKFTCMQNKQMLKDAYMIIKLSSPI